MVDESPLRRAVARLEEAVREGLKNSVPFGTAKVQTYDVGLLFETIKRYGGRKGWEPTDENIAQLPGPVRRYVMRLEEELAEARRRARR